MPSKSPCPKGTASVPQRFSGKLSKMNQAFMRLFPKDQTDLQSSARPQSNPTTTCESSKKPPGALVSFQAATQDFLEEFYPNTRPHAIRELQERLRPGCRVAVHREGPDGGPRVAYLRSDLMQGLFLADIYLPGAYAPEARAQQVSAVHVISVLSCDSPLPEEVQTSGPVHLGQLAGAILAHRKQAMRVHKIQKIAPDVWRGIDPAAPQE